MERLQQFEDSLAGLSDEEARQAKTRCIRNAIAELKALHQKLNSSRPRGVAVWLFPFSLVRWAVLRKLMDTMLRRGADGLRFAIDAWRDDLKGQTFDLDFLDGDRVSAEEDNR